MLLAFASVAPALLGIAAVTDESRHQHQSRLTGGVPFMNACDSAAPIPRRAAISVPIASRSDEARTFAAKGKTSVSSSAMWRRYSSTSWLSRSSYDPRLEETAGHCQPQLAQMVHFLVAPPGAFVILLQRIQLRQQRLQVQVIELAQSWEQALFFIGGVFGSRLAKIAQACRQRRLLLLVRGPPFAWVATVNGALRKRSMRR